MLSVIFDLDDTLCDYGAARQRAKRKIDLLLREHGVPTGAPYWSRFDELDPVLFARFTAGELARDEYRRLRFEIPATDAGADRATASAAAVQANAVYVACANTDIELFDDALPALSSLRAAGAELSLFTNGPSDGQRAKIRNLGLAPYVDHVFISEELGVAKPSPAAFAAVLSHLGRTARQSVMVGDSPTTDIAGARAAGIRAVLVDRAGQWSDPSVETITGLAGLPLLLTAAL
ncbi:HAD family hydrolase [Streptomyces sp. NPDC088762]|uniref:HAD family hydrolase n=1 Tax=Streptomyces sp. NPDC088762 TaxID=3365891 RepID=UPI0037F4FF2B